MTAAVEALREKARGYELSRLAAEERGETGTEHFFGLLAVVLYEVAEAMEAEAA